MILFIFLAPILFNATWLIDTFLTKIFKNEQSDWMLFDWTKTLMLISGIVPLIFAIGIAIINYNQIISIDIYNIYILILCGIVYWLAAYPYFIAFHHDNIDNIIPILQTIPVFTYILWYFALWENLSQYQLTITFFIIIFTALFWRNFQNKTMNRKSVFLILLSSMLYAASYVLFKIWWWESSNIMWSFFWQYIWVSIWCLAFTINRKVRSTTYTYFQKNWRKFSLLNICNEIFFIIWVVVVNYFSLKYPVAIVNTLSQWLQPTLWFIMTYIAYKVRPNIFEREYNNKDIWYKIWLCIICLILLWLFFHSI